MATRRDFLQTAAALPFGTFLGSPLLEIGPWSDTDAGPANDPLYLGKPMSYWLSKAAGFDYDPVELEVMEGWMFQHFGQAAVPGLIEAMKEPSGWLVITELQVLASPATMRALTDAFQHEHPSVRAGVANVIYGIARGPGRNNPELAEPLREAIPVLLGTLKTEHDSETIRMAGWFLHEFAPSLDPTFSFSPALLGCNNPYVLAMAARDHPERFQSEEVVPLLITSLESADSKLRSTAAEALSIFQPEHPNIVPVFVDHVIHRDARCAVQFSNLDRFIEKALPPLRQAMHDASPQRRASILHALGWSGSEAVVPTIIEMLRDNDEEVRSQAVSSLYFFKDSSAKPLLIQAFHDPGQYVRQSARWAFRNRRPLALASLPEFVGLLETGDARGRVSAALAIRDLGENGRTALPALQRNLEHEDPYVRLGAAVVVAKFESNGKDLIHILVTGIDHPEDDLREAAIKEIQCVGAEAKTVLSRIIEAVQHPRAREPLVQILGGFGPDAAPAIPTLIELLKEPDGLESRWQEVVRTLPKIGPKAIGPLMRAIHSGDLVARRRAIEALGRMGPSAKSLVPMLTDLLKSGPPTIRVTAARALGNIGPDAGAAVPVLRGLLDDRDIAIRNSAKAAVDRIDAPGATAARSHEQR